MRVLINSIAVAILIVGCASSGPSKSQRQFDPRDVEFEETLIVKSPWPGNWASTTTSWRGSMNLDFMRDANGYLTVKADGKLAENLLIRNRSVEFEVWVTSTPNRVSVRFILSLEDGQLTGTGDTNTGYVWRAFFSPSR
jgi:hypothetical protein